MYSSSQHTEKLLAPPFEWCAIRLQTILGMPTSIIPIGVLALGYSAEEPLAPEVRQRFRARRRPRSEVVHREQW